MTEAPAGNFIQIDSGNFHSCGLREDGSMVCWGDNSEGQSIPRTGTWDRVSAGDLGTCSINLSIKPWEDYFTPDEKYIEENDCAYIHTYLEDGEVRGEWRAGNCYHDLIPYFACRSKTTGAFAIAGRANAPSTWEYGFPSCTDLLISPVDFSFDAPKTRDEYEQMLDAIGPDKDVWLNYTDILDEGVWRNSNYMSTVYLAQGEGHCMVGRVDQNPYKTDCDQVFNTICEDPDGSLFFSNNWPVGNSWYGAQEACYDSGGVLFLPERDADWKRIYDLTHTYGLTYWLRYTDINYPGHWEDWKYDLD